MTTKPAVSPMIMDVSVARLDDFSDATPIIPGDILGTAGTTTLLVTIAAPTAVEPTAWSGFGAKLDFDKVPSVLNGIDGFLLGDPQWNADMSVWISVYAFDLSDKDYIDGEHDLVLVAYDVANNRYEIAFPIELVANGAGADLSAATVSDLLVDIRSYPVSRGFFGKDGGVSIMALDPFLGTTDVSYRAQLTFKVVDGASADVQIRGFEVLRSGDGGVSFTSVGTQNYGYLSTGSGGVHTYFDADSRLEEGTTYFYKVRVFTDAADTPLSGSAGAKVMAPVSASLVSPSNRSTVTVDAATMTGPDFTFSLSNTELWNAAESDYFYFQLTVNEKAGPYAVLGRFRYNFTTSKFQFQYGTAYYNFEDIFGDDPTDPAYDPEAWWNQNSGYVGYDAGSITVYGFVPYLAYTNYATGAAVNYMAGTAYEWDIIGDYAAGHPAWFEKAYLGGISKSYVDGYSEGADTANGRFEFVAE